VSRLRAQRFVRSSSSALAHGEQLPGPRLLAVGEARHHLRQPGLPLTDEATQVRPTGAVGSVDLVAVEEEEERPVGRLGQPLEHRVQAAAKLVLGLGGPCPVAIDVEALGKAVGRL